MYEEILAQLRNNPVGDVTPLQLQDVIAAHQSLTPGRSNELDARISELTGFLNSFKGNRYTPELARRKERYADEIASAENELEKIYQERYGQRRGEGLKGLMATAALVTPFAVGTAMGAPAAGEVGAAGEAASSGAPIVDVTGALTGTPGATVTSGELAAAAGGAGGLSELATAGKAMSSLSTIANLAGAGGSILGALGAGRTPSQTQESETGFASYPEEVKQYLMETMFPKIKQYAEEGYKGIPKRALDTTDTDPIFGSRRRTEYDMGAV